tara:strand:- start:317 stop:571 length:255 start_codon:yes stop_codon:yes gene_type:complete
MIKRLANHKLVGFIKSGVSASDIGFVNVINSTNIDLNADESTAVGATPRGLVNPDAFGVSVINNSDYDCLDPVVEIKQYDLGAL